MISGTVLSTIGFILSSKLIFLWYEQGLRLKIIPWYVVLGLFMVITGIQMVLFNLVYQSFLLTTNIEK